MAKLTIHSNDAGATIPLAGNLFWDVNGTSNVDLIEVAPEASAKLTLGNSIDSIHFIANSSEYTVHMDGVNAVFTHIDGAEVTIPMTTLGDQLQFGNDSLLDLKIEISESGLPRFLLGDQELSTTSASISSVGGGEGDVSLDGQGTNSVPFLVEASDGAFRFIDSSSITNNVVINNFGPDDSLLVLGATLEDYDSAISSDAAGDVTIAHNADGVLSQIMLTGLAVGTVVFDVASFNALEVGDLVFA